MDATSQFPRLLGPVAIAGLALHSRIVMPPMNTAMPIGSDQFRAWYEARARGGVGLIIMEAVRVHALAHADCLEGLAAALAAVSRYGVPLVLQLFQPPSTPQGDPFAPSATAGTRAATEAELAAVPGTFAEAAAHCRELGFAGVEVHGAHGFFLNCMFSPLTNRRTDRYGGSTERRMTLAREIVAAIRSRVGADYPLFYRHTAEQAEGYTLADSIVFLGELREAGVNVLDISPSTRDLPPDRVEMARSADADAEGASCEPADRSHCDLAGQVRAALGGPVIAVGGMEDPARAEAALRDGKCDLCAVGRQLIADSDWPTKVRTGRLGEVIRCTKCDVKCFGNLRAGVPIGCVENPRSGNEYRLL